MNRSNPFFALVFLSAGASASTLGSHTLLAHEDGHGPGTATTAPLTTDAVGSSLITFSAGYADNTGQPFDNKSNLWTQLGAPVVYRGYNGEFDVKAFVVLDALGGTSHSVSIIKNGVPAGEITVPFIEIRQAGVLQSVAVNYPAAGSVLSSDSVTTSGPATLVAVWWGDATGLHHTALPDNGFNIIENFGELPPDSAVQCVVAARQVTSAGTYHVNWTNTPAQGAPLWLFAFQNHDGIFATNFD